MLEMGEVFHPGPPEDQGNIHISSGCCKEVLTAWVVWTKAVGRCGGRREVQDQPVIRAGAF